MVYVLSAAGPFHQLHTGVTTLSTYKFPLSRSPVLIREFRSVLNPNNKSFTVRVFVRPPHIRWVTC